MQVSTNSSITVNGTTFNLGDSKTITAASSTLLGDSNTFTGANMFSSTTLSGNTLLSNATTTNFGFSGLSNAVLAVNSSGTVIATTSIGTNQLTGTLGVANGGTGSTTLGGLLTGNGTSALTAAVVNAPLTFSGNTLAINQATLSQNGYLSSTDFNTFNNKISSSSLSSANGYLTYNSSTGVFTASTSPTYTNATSTNFGITSVSSALLKTLSDGAVVAAVAGTDYATPANIASAFEFTPQTWGNSTSTTIGFINGIIANASSTIISTNFLSKSDM